MRQSNPSESRSGARRLLFVAGVFPYPATNGYAMRTGALLESLAACGYEIDFLTFGEPTDLESAGEQIRSRWRTVEVVPHTLPKLSGGRDYWRRLATICQAQPYTVERFRSTAMKEKILSRLRHHPVNAILCDSPYTLVNFPEVLPAPLILNTHNIEHILFERYGNSERNPARRTYAWLEGQKLRRWEQAAWTRASLVMVCSRQDQRVVQEFCPRLPVAVVPNTVDVERYSARPGSDGSTVVYLGGMDWYPNRDAVEFFISEILPPLRKLVPGLRFVVAGRRGPDQFHRRFTGLPGVEFTGTMADIRPQIGKAAVCVVPLRIGSGTRLKILEAAAMGKPVVSTRIGAEGLNLVEGEEILLADAPQDFAQQVARLLVDKSRSQQMGQAARRRVEQHYSFPVLRNAVQHALELLEPTATLAPTPERSPVVQEVGS